MNEKIYTLKEAAEILKISYRTAHRLVCSGELGHMRVGGMYRVRASDIDALSVRSQDEEKD